MIPMESALKPEEDKSTGFLCSRRVTGKWPVQGVVGEHVCRCVLASYQTFKVQGPSRGSRAVGGRDSQVDFGRLMGPLSLHMHAQTPRTLFRPCFHLVC